MSRVTIAVCLEPNIVKAVREEAVKHRRSVSSMVAELLLVGLGDMKATVTPARKKS